MATLSVGFEFFHGMTAGRNKSVQTTIDNLLAGVAMDMPLPMEICHQRLPGHAKLAGGFNYRELAQAYRVAWAWFAPTTNT